MPGRHPGRRVTGGQVGVGGDNAGESVGVLAHQPQTQQAAPVLADQGDVG